MELNAATIARFRAKLQAGKPDACWLWNAFINPSGYGMIRIGKRMELSHRVAWVIAHGQIPAELHVLHRCDTPACCNAAHLFLGTNADNVADKVAKGRASFAQPKKQGERHHAAKLTPEQVDAIRAADPHEKGIGRRLARQFGVSPSTITNVRKGKVWTSASP